MDRNHGVAAALGLAGLVGAFLISSSASAQSSFDWPSVQGGPAHLGAADGEAPAPALTRTWRVAAEGNARLSGAVVGAGVAVAVGMESVVAFDPSSGVVRWTVVRESGPLDPPALDKVEGGEGVVVFTEGDDSETAAVVAIGLGDQAELWRVDLDDPARGGPAIAEDAVVVGTHGGGVLALDLATGEERWTFAATGRVDTAPAVADGLAYVVAEDFDTGVATLHALVVSDGSEAWSYIEPAVSVRVSSVTVADGTVFAGFGDAAVRAFEATRGTLRWESRVRGLFSPATIPAYADGSLYIADRSGTLTRFDGDTGRRVWDHQLPSQVLRGSPLVGDAVVYVGMENGTLGAIERATGDLMWETSFRSGAVGPLAPAGDILLVPSGSGALGSRAGGIFALRNDPNGTTIRVEPPSRLKPVIALANFGLAFAATLTGLLALFRVALRPRGRRGSRAGAEPEDLE